jgi:DNA-binding MarR family transcriptional regulator
MPYDSETESSADRESATLSDTEPSAGHHARVDQAVDLLPSIGKLLFMTVSRYPGLAGRSLAQVKMLIHLHHSGSCTVSELAGACGVSMSAASELIDRLVADDMIIRGSNPEDRRQVLLTPTLKARELGNKIRAMRERQIEVALGKLSSEHEPAFLPVLKALAETLQEDFDGNVAPAHRFTEVTTEL